MAQRCETFRKARGLACVVAFLISVAGPAAGQERKSKTSARNAALDPFVAWAAIWGDPNHEGVYTCEQWKAYATGVFNAADSNRDGRRSVSISIRRIKSPSLTIPSKFPSFETTGTALIRFSSRISATSCTERSGPTVMTGETMTSAALIPPFPAHSAADAL